MKGRSLTGSRLRPRAVAEVPDEQPAPPGLASEQPLPAAGATSGRLKRALLIMGGLCLSLLALYLAVREIDLAAAGAALLTAGRGWISLALLSVAVNTIAKAARWKELLGEAGAHVGLGSYLSALLVGQMLNTLAPARVGELSRAYLLGGLGPGRAFTLGAVFLEKLIDLLAYALVFCLFLFLAPLPTWLDGSPIPLLGVLALGAGAVLLVTTRPEQVKGFLVRSLRLLPARWSAYLLPRFVAGLNSVQVLRGWPSILRLSLWTALIWATAVLTNHLVLLALDLHLPWTASLLVLIVLQVGISLPAGPGRIGIFEWMCILSLGVFAVDRQPAFSYGILLHAIVLLPTTLLGVFCAWLFNPQGRRSIHRTA